MIFHLYGRLLVKVMYMYTCTGIGIIGLNKRIYVHVVDEIRVC